MMRRDDGTVAVAEKEMPVNNGVDTFLTARPVSNDMMLLAEVAVEEMHRARDKETATEQVKETETVGSVEEQAHLEKSPDDVSAQKRQRSSEAPPNKPEKKTRKTARLSWDQRFEQLKLYKREHGDCFVSRQYHADPSLGTWVGHQRQMFRQYMQAREDGKPLSSFWPRTLERMALLEELKFEVCAMDGPNTRIHERWKERFEQLKAYKEEHGDCLVPFKYTKDRSFASWVSDQRREYRRHKEELLVGKPLSSVSSWKQERMALLEALDFEVSSLTRPWKERYGELRLYKQAHGHCFVPRQYVLDRSFGSWVAHQRHAYRHHLQARRAGKPPSKFLWLTDDRFALLAELDFEPTALNRPPWGKSRGERLLQPKTQKERRQESKTSSCQQQQAACRSPRSVSIGSIPRSSFDWDGVDEPIERALKYPRWCTASNNVAGHSLDPRITSNMAERRTRRRLLCDMLSNGIGGQSSVDEWIAPNAAADFAERGGAREQSRGCESSSDALQQDTLDARMIASSRMVPGKFTARGGSSHYPLCNMPSIEVGAQSSLGGRIASNVASGSYQHWYTPSNNTGDQSSLDVGIPFNMAAVKYTERGGSHQYFRSHVPSNDVMQHSLDLRIRSNMVTGECADAVGERAGGRRYARHLYMPSYDIDNIGIQSSLGTQIFSNNVADGEFTKRERERPHFRRWHTSMPSSRNDIGNDQSRLDTRRVASNITMTTPQTENGGNASHGEANKAAALQCVAWDVSDMF